MNFALILFVASVLTGSLWLIDYLIAGRKRAPDAKLPILVEYSKSFFPVILAVFLLRSFLVEPFKIPSGSMIPTLQIGDFILVNKFQYGIRLPVINRKIIDIDQPQHGDVMVFRFPQDEGIDYIKRVIGLPGDTLEYRNKRLTINGIPVPMRQSGQYEYVASGLNLIRGNLYTETLDRGEHIALVQPEAPSVIPYNVADFPQRERCRHDETGFVCKVPEGHYLMLGDNRDESNDSRYWGFVPDRNIVGRAFMIWWNFDDFVSSLKNLSAPQRIGKFIDE